MMKRTSRLLALVLALAMICAMVPGALALEQTAARKGKCGKNAYWSVDRKGALTITGTGDMYDYDVYQSPWGTKITSVTVDGGITYVGTNAFYDSDRLKTATLKSGVQTLGEYAFAFCDNLKTVRLPSTLTRLNSYAFFETNGLTGITIPDSVVGLGLGIFSACTNLSQVKLSKGLTEIPDDTFWGCTSLTDVTIPNGVGQVGRTAFYNCTRLKNVTIPRSVFWMEEDAFTYRNKKLEQDEPLPGLTISGYYDTYAQAYAQDHHFRFKALDKKRAAPAITKLENVTGGIKLSYNRPSGAKAFRILVKSDGKWVKVADTAKNSIVLKKIKGKALKAGTEYTFTVQCISSVGGSPVSDYNKTGKSIVYLTPPTITTCKSEQKGAVTLKWKADPNASGYEIRYSATGNCKNGKPIIVKGRNSTSKVISNLVPGRLYCFCVRTYTISHGKRVYSDCSANKTVTVMQ